MDARVEIRLLGTVAVLHGGRAVELRSRQLRALVAYVGEHADRTISRDDLALAVWGEDLPPAPATALRALLCRLRAAVPIADRGCGGVALDDAVEVDVQVVRREVAGAEVALEAAAPAAAFRLADSAARRLREPCCAGLTAPWLDELRAELEDLADAALLVAARAGPALGGAQLSAALRSALALCRRRPLSESAHTALMEIQAAAGDGAEALATYDAFRRRLDRELGAVPSARVRDHHARLLAGDATVTPTELQRPYARVAP